MDPPGPREQSPLPAPGFHRPIWNAAKKSAVLSDAEGYTVKYPAHRGTAKNGITFRRACISPGRFPERERDAPWLASRDNCPRWNKRRGPRLAGSLDPKGKLRKLHQRGDKLVGNRWTANGHPPSRFSLAGTPGWKNCAAQLFARGSKRPVSKTRSYVLPRFALAGMKISTSG